MIRISIESRGLPQNCKDRKQNPGKVRFCSAARRVDEVYMGGREWYTKVCKSGFAFNYIINFL